MAAMSAKDRGRPVSAASTGATSTSAVRSLWLALVLSVLGLSALDPGRAWAQAGEGDRAAVAEPSAAAPAATDIVDPECPACPAMARLAGGSFAMGYEYCRAPRPEHGHTDFACPRRTIRVAPFAMALREVTVGAFGAFARAMGLAPKPCRYPLSSDLEAQAPTGPATWEAPGFPQGDQHPVVCVSWEDAEAFAAWLNRQTGRTGAPDAYRLPSEAEWEYAARAGAQEGFAWGTTASGGEAACLGCTMPAFDPPLSQKEDGRGSGPDAGPRVQTRSLTGPVPTGALAANAFGLHDMHGNVWEWVADPWTRGYYQGAAVEGWRRVIRGGGWASRPHELRAAYRNSLESTGRSVYLGFRLARSIAEPSQDLSQGTERSPSSPSGETP